MASEEPQISVMRGRALLLAAGAIWGTYAVLLKAINSGDAKPLPAIFVTAARYQFLCLFAFLQKKWFAFRDRGTASASAIGKGAPSAPNSGRTIAAAELAAIAVGSTLLSIWGVSLVPSVTSEILASTVHIFVPLLTLFASGSFASSDFGLLTWIGCIVSFLAALAVAIVAATASGPVPRAPIIGQLAVVVSAIVLALQRVRAQIHLRKHAAAHLNNERMLWMGYISLGLLVADALRGGSSASTLLEIGSISSKQWALMALSVFLSAFVAAGFQYEAQAVIPAANAQPFLALQPIFSAAWAYVLLGEPVAPSALAGGVVQIGGALIASKDDTVRAAGGEKKQK